MGVGVCHKGVKAQALDVHAWSSFQRRQDTWPWVSKSMAGQEQAGRQDDRPSILLA